MAIMVSKLKPCRRDNVNVYTLAIPLSRLITIIDPTRNTSTNKTFSNWPHICRLSFTLGELFLFPFTDNVSTTTPAQIRDNACFFFTGKYFSCTTTLSQQVTLNN